MHNPRNFWTKEQCFIEALKFSTRREFKLQSSTAYNSCLRNKWINEACAHMKTKPRKSLNFWTLENCKIDALKYKTIKDWRNNSMSGYAAAKKNKWLGDCTNHMIKLGSHYSRKIYAFEFKDNHVYVGLSFNPDQRKENHFIDKKSQVYKHIQRTELQPNFIILSDFLSKEIASIKEGEILNEYKNNGWLCLNVATTGALGGGNLFWNFERCLESALKFTTKNEWQRNEYGAYKSAKTRGWFSICTKHMKRPPSEKLIWTLEKCKEEAKKYTSKSEWKRNSKYSYQSAVIHKWVNECSKHMKRPMAWNKKPTI